MPGVDLADQKRHGRIVARPRMKRWDQKFFLHMIDISLVNSFIIAKHIPSLNRLKHAEFRVQIVDQLANEYAIDTVAPARVRAPLIRQERLVGRHVSPAVFPDKKRKRCVVCSARGERKDTDTYCEDCDVALCIKRGCFKVYHTEQDFAKV
jgi:hypothetical protein